MNRSSFEANLLPLHAALANVELLGFKRGLGNGIDLIAKSAFVGVNQITVTNSGDMGAGSLRDALSQASMQGGAEIRFAPSLAGQTINLGSSLIVTKFVTIDGGSNNITISGQNNVTDFVIQAGSGNSAYINNLTIANGKGTGLDGTAGSGANAPGGAGGDAAGGIFVQTGQLYLSNDTFTNNTATGGAGGRGGTDAMGTFSTKGAGGAGGNAAGAVYVEPGATIGYASNLIASDNTATGGGGGAGNPNNHSDGMAGTAYQESNNAQVVNASTVCYCTGTRIRTDRGDVAVEALAIGDRVVTASGSHRPIKWIGHRAYAGRFANANPDLLPICIKADALAEGIPARDLWVSPKHALFLDGVLIPAATLVNGVSIVKVERVDSLTYWHVELDSHDVLIAENTPAESFIDDNGRGIFHNAHTFHTMYPGVVATVAVYCAPRVEDGHAVAGARARINVRAGLPSQTASFGKLRGYLDVCDVTGVSGWAQDAMYPDAPVCLDILVDGRKVAMAYADQHRLDLQQAGFGDGCHGFHVALRLDPSSAHVVEVRRSADGMGLMKSAWHVPDASAEAA